MLCGLLPGFPFALWKEFWTILEFASLQTQNLPSGLRHWVCDRFALLRMVSQNSFMFAPGNPGNIRFVEYPWSVLTSPADCAQEQRSPPKKKETPAYICLTFNIFNIYKSKQFILYDLFSISSLECGPYALSLIHGMVELNLLCRPNLSIPTRPEEPVFFITIADDLVKRQNSMAK